MIKSRLLPAACACLLSTGINGTASAAFVLTIDDLSTLGATPDVVITDENGVNSSGLTNTGSDGHFGQTGAISFSGSTADFSFVITSGFSQGTEDNGIMHLNSFQINSLDDGMGQLVISLTDTDFNLADLAGYTAQTGAVAPATVATGGSIGIDYYYNPLNSEFGTEDLVASHFGNSGGFSDNTTDNTLLPDTDDIYSLTITATVIHNIGGSSSFDAKLTPVITGTEIPVPAAAWLFGSGLLGLVGVARRRKFT